MLSEILCFFFPEIKTLVQEMHACVDRINDLFGGAIPEDSTETIVLDGTIWVNPARLCYTVRQALREEAIGEDFKIYFIRLWVFYFINFIS